MTDPSTAVVHAVPAGPEGGRRRLLWWLWVGLVLLAAAVGIGFKLAREKARDEAAGARFTPTSDFGVFHHSAERFLAGEPLYRAGVLPAPAGERQNLGDAAMGYKYGPLFAMLLAPLGLLPVTAAAILWSLCNLLAILGLGWLLGRWVRRYFFLRPAVGAASPCRAPTAWGWSGLLGSAFFLQLNLVYGQTNLLFMFLLLAGLELYAVGRPVRGGLLAGLVAGMRLTPLVFLPYFLWKRQWRASAGMLLGLALSFALPAAWWGPTEFSRQMQEWRELVAADEALDSTASHALADAAAGTPVTPATPAATTADSELYYLRPTRYQSIPPMVLDTFAENYTPQPGERLHPYQGQRNFLRGLLDRRQATHLAYGLASLFCLACAFLCWRNYPPGDLRHPLEWALVLTAMILVSPYTERTHYAALVPALGLIVAGALTALQRSSLWPPAVVGPAVVAPARAWLLVAGAAAIVLFFNGFNQSVLPRAWAEFFKGFHGFVLGAMAVFVVLAVWLGKEQRRAAATAAVAAATP